MTSEPFQIGDKVIIRGGFEDGIRGTIVANEPLNERPYRYRVRVRRCGYCGNGPCVGSARTAAGHDVDAFHRHHPNNTTIGGLNPINLELITPAGSHTKRPT